jgi:hypothetical protein
MKLSAPQQVISDDGARFKVAACGRRFGKSFLSINEMAKAARFPNQKILYIAPTYRQAKTVIWDELKAQLYAVNWIDRVNESDLTITLINGSTIAIRSSDNKDALRGTKYNYIVLDECAFMQPDVWYSVLRPTLSDTGGKALFITSPSGRNWVYDLWVNAGQEEDWSAHQYTTLDGGNVPAEEIEAAKRDLDIKQFEQEYLASFITWAGTIFYAYSDEHNLKKYDWSKFTDTTALHLSIDFNTSPITCGVWVKHQDTLHCVDEIEIYGSNTLELVQEIRNRYGNRQYIAFPDATGSRKNTNSMGVSDHLILSNNGFKVVTDKTNPNVNDSISSVNSMLCSTTGERKLFIDPACKKIRQCMMKYVFKEGTRIPDKDNIHDHFADGIRYICHRMFPLKKLPMGGSRVTRMNAGRMLG